MNENYTAKISINDDYEYPEVVKPIRTKKNYKISKAVYFRIQFVISIILSIYSIISELTSFTLYSTPDSYNANILRITNDTPYIIFTIVYIVSGIIIGKKWRASWIPASLVLAFLLSPLLGCYLIIYCIPICAIIGLVTFLSMEG